MTGATLTTFITGLNGGASIDATLLEILVQSAQAILEEERPWMVLRKTDTSKTVTTGNSWQTAIDLSTIADFSRLYVASDGVVLRIFDGNNNIQYYTLKPFDQRLEYKDVSNTCVFDENTKTLYLNGTIPFNGTLYISYLSSSTLVDVDSASEIWTLFPVRFHPILGFYAVDYDSINKQMLPENRATLLALREAMEKWDNEKQMAALQSNDPTEFPGGYPRAGAVDRSQQ